MTVQRGAAPTVTHDGFGKPITVGDQVITVSSRDDFFSVPLNTRAKCRVSVGDLLRA